MSHFEPVVGRYVHFDVDGVRYRTYFEANGEGIPLVCLHTAGADAIEYRHLLNDQEITRQYRVIAFDMPWHGRSLPPYGWWQQEYKLTSDFYVKFIMAFVEALELERAVLLGCSMGGYVMLNIAYEYPGRFAGLIAVEPRSHAPPLADIWDYLAMPEVNPTGLSRPLAYSLSSPEAPEEYRREVEWIYASSGPGVLRGDLIYAGHEHDARPFLDQIDGTAQPLYLVGGDYDWTCYAEHTRDLASRIKGAKEVRIPDAGHFPPSEHPASFKQAIRPILDEIRDVVQCR